MKTLLEKRCRRAIAVVLSAKEREADQFLSPDVQARLRKVIIDQFNDFAAIAIDIVDSLENGSVMNDLWLEKMDQILAAVNEMT